MAQERRYTDEEVETILKQAAEAQSTQGSLLPVGEGMTLSQLQEIAREAGISVEAVQYAARNVGSARALSTQKFLGLPLGVARTVELERKLTDEEWDRLVADLRTTFNAKGIVTQEGSLRTWRNGNLHVYLEPTATGNRLRLRTVRGGSRGLLQTGIAMVGMGALMAAAAAIKGSLSDAEFLSSVTTMMLTGGAMFGAGAVMLPSWARRRKNQMDEIADRVSSETMRRLPDV
jgi:hypothetical protein